MRRPVVAHEYALLIGAAILLALEFAIPANGQFGVLGVGFLGGMVFGLTNVNDYRLNRGRKAFAEKPLMGAFTLLAFAGFFGAILTWLLLVPFYWLQGAARYDYDPSLSKFGHDIDAALRVGVALPGVHEIPAFLVVGVFTVVYTGVLLHVIEADPTTHGAYGVVIPVAVLLIDIVIGAAWQDHLTTIEFGLVFVMFAAVVAIRIPSGAPDTPADVDSEPVVPTVPQAKHAGVATNRVMVLALLAVIGWAAADFATRRSVGVEFSGNGATGEVRSAMVSLCFRALYFSMFVPFAIIWFLLKRETAAREILSPETGGVARRTALVTAGLFTVTFFLTVPAIASSLALGPLAVNAGLVLAFALAGAVYGSTGISADSRGRLRETLLAPGWRGRANTLGYVTLIAALFVWTFKSL